MRNPNLLDPRTAMGLPGRFHDRLGLNLLSAHEDLFECDAAQLIEVLESISADRQRRFAAGLMLGLRGDPRISIERPQMIRLAGGRVTLGLSRHGVERVVAQWAHHGVQREWILKECPEYECDVAPFALARFPVTNAEYRAFLEATHSDLLPTSWQFGMYPAWFANHPVWTVPPAAADAYAAWLNERTGRRFRLPTEAEWEYAASDGGRREYPWGDEFDSTCANTAEDGPLFTSPVGMYPRGRSAAGIDDMGGNVEEYTADDYAVYPGGETIDDDLLRICGTYRVARGGSFTRFGDLARCRRRHGWYPGAIYAMGFRLAETL
ncbi:formylglycine-generating enzyme family protein [Burkholderia cenocepacia]|uniref:formylglycine-generating enzyme family protein n=1 Tax=Burkholderia cenocepacia TaxID=95486 RepID=UPI001F4B8CA6|nr:SUMF1/EgtB/PvdO family nonheme iron enzyme [Burkholderia cenocepacia]